MSYYIHKINNKAVLGGITIMAKTHGVTQKEIAAVITHAAFYAGWPKAWAVFNLAKEYGKLTRTTFHMRMRR